MSDQLEDVDLSGDALHVSHVDDSILFKDLDGHLLAGGDVGCQFDLTKGALS